MFQVEHRIVIANGCFEQSFGIIGCRGNDDLDTRSMEEPGFRAGRVEWPALDASARGTTNDHRDRHTSAPVHLICHIDDLIEATGNEVDELHFGDWPHAHQRRTHGGADDCIFSHWSIDNTL